MGTVSTPDIIQFANENPGNWPDHVSGLKMVSSALFLPDKSFALLFVQASTIQVHLKYRRHIGVLQMTDRSVLGR